MDQQTAGLDKATTISVIRSWEHNSSIHPNMLAAFLMSYEPTLLRYEVGEAADAVLEVMWHKRGDEQLRVLLMMLDVFMHENTIRCFGHVLSIQNSYLEHVIEALSIEERVQAALYVLEEGAQRIDAGNIQIDDCLVDGTQYAELAKAFLPGKALVLPSDTKRSAAYRLLLRCVDDCSNNVQDISLRDLSETVQLVFGLEPPNPTFVREWRGELDIPTYLENRLLGQGLRTWQQLLSKSEDQLSFGNENCQYCVGRKGMVYLKAALAKRGYRIGQLLIKQ